MQSYFNDVMKHIYLTLDGKYVHNKTGERFLRDNFSRILLSVRLVIN